MDQSDAQTAQPGPAPEAERFLVWFMANPPGQAFRVETASLDEALLVDVILTDYSLHLGDRLIPVSAGGIERWVDGDWEDHDLTMDDDEIEACEAKREAIRARLRVGAIDDDE